MKHIIIALFLSVTLFACKSTKEASTKVTESAKSIVSVEKWIIAGEKVKCDEGAETLCYQVKPAGSSDYNLMDVTIENFAYEAGYKYQIELKVITLKDGSTQHVLVKEIYKVASK